MTVRLLVGVAFVANILVLVLSEEITQVTATSESLASANSSSSYASSSSSAKAVVKSKPVKCRRVKKCPKNEEFSFCPETMQRAQYCSEKAEPSTYRSTSGKPCDEGCVCKENYLRAENGTCIPAEQCPITCGAKEVLDNCPTDCQSDYCPTEEDTEAKPCVTPDVCPPPVCKCAFNHRRASNGSCISTKECPPFACRTNEEYNPCPPLCPTDDCTQASPSGECPPQFGNIGIILPCNPKCRCIKDYWRLDGICVPYGQCPGVCPENERYSTCIQAECRALNCSQKDQSVPCIQSDPAFCEKGCVCEEGYLRNEDGICVLEDKCEPPPSCVSANEEFVPCIQGVCRAKDCSQKGKDIPCPDIPQEQCDNGCICKEHFLRAANGSCVPEDQCEPNPCQPNEEFSNCTQAICRALNCSDKGKPQSCPSVAEGDCEKGCVCQEGYLRTEAGCVLEEKCNANKCPPFEQWDECANAVCRANFCYQKGLPVPCPSVSECIPGCLCQSNYLRDESGVCVPEEDCTPNPCPVNEELSNCTQAVCRTQNCTDTGKSVGCPLVAEGDCEKGCVCKEGYLRVEDGLYCVPEDECNANKCPLYEVWDDCANAACRAQNCTQKGLSVVCPSVTECVPGCLCRPDYLRHADGFCVSEEDCNTHFCPFNEEWSTCAQATCRAQNCSEKGETIFCPLIAEGDCKEACVCKENYLRNVNGDCVPEDQCPPKSCGENEVLDNCSLDCNSDKCPQSADEEQVCIKSDPCVPACKCSFNYKRSENGTCIPTRDCPPFDCSAKPYEEFVACPPFCPTDECGKPRLEGRCPFKIGTFLQCNPKCQCMDGYGRVNGTCVPFEECPDLCPANEVYSPCVQQTCRRQNCSDRDLAMATCPSYDAASCQRGCVCQENYYRNDKGVCVSYEECGGPMCPNAHEEYIPNFKECPPNICKSLVAKYACDENQKEGPGCMCKSGYLRLSVTSPCIPICDCPEMKNSPDC